VPSLGKGERRIRHQDNDYILTTYIFRNQLEMTLIEKEKNEVKKISRELLANSGRRSSCWSGVNGSRPGQLKSFRL
jgi:hypothetical protein